MKWRSPDMGHGIGSFGLGTFTAQGGGTEKGLIVITASGEVWAIQTQTSPPQAHNIPAGTLHFGGERELPVLAVGERANGVTPVYVVGTSDLSNPTPGQPNGTHPNSCYVSRVDFTSIYNVTTTPPTYVGQEICEPMTQLHWDAVKDELVGTSARGYLFRMKDVSSGSFDMSLLATTDNFGLGEYLGITPRQVKRVNLDGDDVYFVVGHSQTDRSNPNAPAQKNVLALSACGQILAEELAQWGTGPSTQHDLNCLEVIATTDESARIVVGGIDGLRFLDFDYDSGTPTSSTFTIVQDTTIAEAFWSTRRFLDPQNSYALTYLPEPVISLEYFEEVSVGPGQGFGEPGLEGRLVGTTPKGIVFVWDLPSSFSAPPQFPTIVDQLSPYWGAWGLKVIDHAFNEFSPYDVSGTPPFGCPIDNDLTLNVMPTFSYDHTFTPWDDRFASMSFFDKRDARTGAFLCRRERPQLGSALNPDQRDPDAFANNTADELVWDILWNAQTPVLDTHYFQETVDLGVLGTSATIDAAYTPQDLDGRLDVFADYLNSTPPATKYPSSGSYLLSDRYYVNSEVYVSVSGQGTILLYQPVYLGNAVRIGNVLTMRGETIQNQNVVMTTIGGRILIISGGTPILSWSATAPWSTTGDFGFHLTGLALCDVDGDGYDEIFAVGGTYTDPSGLSSDISSHLLIWDSGSGGINLAAPSQKIDLGDIGCFGLWVGPALGEDGAEFDIIIGGSQTFSVYRIDTTQQAWISTPRYRSVGLGTNIGAMNSILVHRDIVSEQEVYDYVFLGSSAFVYAYRSQSFSLVSE